VDQVTAFVLKRQETLAASAKTRGKEELAAWAASCAAWTVANIMKKLNPTAFSA
jgi:hypothetical protein